MSRRVIADVLGLIRADEDERLCPFVPSVVQFNVEHGDDVSPGDEVEIRLRVRVQHLVPTPLPEV